MQYRKFWKISFWIVLALLLFLTLTPQPPKPISLRHIDKAYHFFAFFGFAFIFRIGFRRWRTSHILWISIFVGVGIEAAQFYIPGRGMSIADAVADILGAIAGVGIGNLWLQRETERDKC